MKQKQGSKPMRVKRYVIPLKPKAWTRAGVNFKEKKFYDRQVTQKSLYAIYLENEHNNEPLFKAPSIEVFFYFEPVSKKKDWFPLHLSKPDVDNCLKLILDSVKGILVSDDCVFPTVIGHKRYVDKSKGEKESILLVLTELWKEEYEKKK